MIINELCEQKTAHPSKIRKKLATNFTNDHELKILSLILKTELT